MEVYGERLVNRGAQIVETRLRYLRQFVPSLQSFYHRLSGENTSLSVVYHSLGYRWEEGVEEGLRRAKEKTQEEEREKE